MLKQKKPAKAPSTFCGLVMLDEIIEEMDRQAGYRQRAQFIRVAVQEKLVRDADQKAAA